MPAYAIQTFKIRQNPNGGSIKNPKHENEQVALVVRTERLETMVVLEASAPLQLRGPCRVAIDTYP